MVSRICPTDQASPIAPKSNEVKSYTLSVGEAKEQKSEQTIPLEQHATRTDLEEPPVLTGPPGWCR
eukprot:6213738-Pleurochrysis_carterae.AAC.1